MKERLLSKVFGVSRDVPLTYVERPAVDDKFRHNLAREKHLVVYGRSKQGKTCLHKNCLKPDQYIVIQCGSTANISQIYAAILKEAGAAITVTEKRTTSGAVKLGVEFEASGKIPLIAAGKGATKGEGERKSDTSKELRYLEVDPSDPNDIIRVLDTMNFHKFIMLEDFHYLPREVQVRVAIDLKAFHEKSTTCCFIIVGVWLEPNRLVLYNGDLSGRLIPIDADSWQDSELRRVIIAGESLLNISFPQEVQEEIVQAAQGNIGLLQETCYRLCERNGVLKTLPTPKSIGTVEQVNEIVKEFAFEQAGRYQNLLRHFVEATPEGQESILRWVSFMLVTATPNELISGLPAGTILERIRQHHPQKLGVSRAEFQKALSQISMIQHNEQVKPIVFDFDANADVLRVVDSGFILYVQAVPDEELIRLLEMESVVKVSENVAALET